MVTSPKLRLGLRALVALLLLGCSGYMGRIEDGDKHFKAGDFEQALAAYERAREIDPERPEARDKITQTHAKLMSKWTTESQAALDKGAWLDAARIMGKLHAKMPEHAGAKALIADTQAKVLAATKRLEAEGGYAQALAACQGLIQHAPPAHGAATARANTLKAAWAQALDAEAVKAEAAKQPAKALLLRAKGVKLDPLPERVEIYKALRARLEDELAYEVEVDKGAEATRAIMSRVVPPRDGLLRVLSPGARREGAEAKLRFTLTAPRTQTHRSTHQASARYKSGTEQVPNPSYKSAQDEVTRYERAVLRRQEEVERQQAYVEKYTADVAREGPSPNVSTGAEQNLTNARSRLESARRGLQSERRQLQRAQERLRSTPQTRTQDTYADHRYTVTRHRQVTTAEVRGVIEHADQRAALPLQFALEVSAEDEAHPAQPIADVPEDPLQLPSAAEQTQALYHQASRQILRALLSSLEGHRAGQLAAARALKDEGERVDGLVLYALLDLSAVPADVAATLTKATGIPDPVEALKP